MKPSFWYYKSHQFFTPRDVFFCGPCVSSARSHLSGARASGAQSCAGGEGPEAVFFSRAIQIVGDFHSQGVPKMDGS